MLREIKALSFRIAPRTSQWFFARRQRRHIDKVLAQAGLPRIASLVSSHFNGIVAGGPFAGMKYAGQASGSTTAPKLIGSYEAELIPWIERLCTGAFQTVIDVGCAEGYYAVGMAMRCPAARIVAFDIDSVARSRCAALAGLNGVQSRVQVRGECNAHTLANAIWGNTLVICDAEGFEAILLDPASCTVLTTTTMLVELHEHFMPGVTALLRSRFAETHEWEQVSSTGRNPADFPSIQFLAEADRPLALTEMRNGMMDWALLTPRNSTAQVLFSGNTASKPGGSGSKSAAM